MAPFLLLIVVVILFTFGVVFLLANWFYAGLDRNEQARREWAATGLCSPRRSHGRLGGSKAILRGG